MRGHHVMVRADTPIVSLNRSTAVRWYFHFFRDPLRAMLRINAAHGPLVQLPLGFATSPRKRLVIATGASFNEDVLHDPATWRTVRITAAGPKDSAYRRLGM